MNPIRCRAIDIRAAATSTYTAPRLLCTAIACPRQERPAWCHNRVVPGWAFALRFDAGEAVVPGIARGKLGRRGFIMSVWWSAAARFDEKLKEAERIDKEYRDLLLSFADSLFDIINALNTLANNPPKPFIMATEFLLTEYIHTLQSQLHRYGDSIAGLRLDATAFLNEKIRIFGGIRERASLSIQDMPSELESLFINTLNLDIDKASATAASRQQQFRGKLKLLSQEQKSTSRAKLPATAE